MGFKMKGSPAKLGSIQGTAGHRSALKMAAEAEAAKNSPVPIIGAIAGAASKVGKVAGKVTGAINKVKGAFKKGKEEGESGDSPNKHIRTFGQHTSYDEMESVDRHNKAHRSGKYGDDHKNTKTGADDMDKQTNQLSVTNLRAKKRKEAEAAKKKALAQKIGKAVKGKEKSKEELAENSPNKHRIGLNKAKQTQGEMAHNRGHARGEYDRNHRRKSPAKHKMDKRGFKHGHKFHSETVADSSGTGHTSKDKKKSPGKFWATAAKVVGKGLMGRAKQKDARDAAINEGVQKAMSRKL